MSYPNEDDLKVRSSVERSFNILSEFDEWVTRFARDRETGSYPIPADEQFQILQRRRTLENLRTAATVPAALAIYGASQSGKSLFVGHLIQCITPGSSSLGLNGSDSRPAGLDFAEHLNPRFGVEATAVVTRFTLAERACIDEELQNTPVRARLFSRCDMIKALGRGFLNECKGLKEWPEAELEKTLSEFYDKAPADRVDLGWRADLVEAYHFLKVDMIHHKLKAHPDSFGQLLARYPLQPEAYIEFTCLLFWENWRQISGLFQKMLELRESRLGDDEYLYLPWEAVPFILDSTVPQERKIDAFGDEPLQWQKFILTRNHKFAVLQYGGGAIGRLTLAVLQGVVSELQIPLVEQNLKPCSLDLFRRGDCLDIPGAVAAAGRAGWTLQTFQEEAKTGETPPELTLLKRGKVGLLFEKYAEEQQASILLYLQATGNLAAKSELPPHLEKWGQHRFGDSWPKGLGQVEQNAPHLFVGLTNIDNLLQRLEPGEKPFQELVGSQLAGHFSSWMHNYGGENRAFRNVFLLRYPGTIDKVDVSEIPGLSDWKRLFLNTPAVEKHLHDPAARWESAMGPDGGLEELLSRIVNQLDNTERRRLLQNRADVLLGAVHSQMQVFWVDPSFKAEEARRRKVAENLLRWIKEDQYGKRSRAFIQALHCNQEIVNRALADEEPPPDSPIPLSPDFNKVVRSVLNEWRATRQWSALTSLGIDEDIMIKYANHVTEYLDRQCLDQMVSKFKDIYSGSNDQDRNKLYARYAVMIVDDFLFTPGERGGHAEGGERLYPFEVIGNRYEAILADRLILAIEGAGATIPPGNEELRTLLDSISTTGEGE